MELYIWHWGQGFSKCFKCWSFCCTKKKKSDFLPFKFILKNIKKSHFFQKLLANDISQILYQKRTCKHVHVKENGWLFFRGHMNYIFRWHLFWITSQLQLGFTWIILMPGEWKYIEMVPSVKPGWSICHLVLFSCIQRMIFNCPLALP